jgi:hypothetical protein
MGLLYGRAGRLTAENGGFRPGQMKTLHGAITNTASPTLRLSADVRWQPGADPVDGVAIVGHGPVLVADGPNFAWPEFSDRHTVGLGPDDRKWAARTGLD